MSEYFDLLAALTMREAKAFGLLTSFFDSSKHNDEASCPNSMFGGLLNVQFSILISGNVLLKAEARVDLHSFLNSAKGFLEVNCAVSTTF